MKTCKQGYYYCFTDKKCKKIPMGYYVMNNGRLMKDDESEGEENKNGNGTSNGNGGNGNGTSNGNGGGVSESKSGDRSLRDWFGKSRSSDGTPGWVQLGGKYAGKPCARQPGQTTKPKCGSSKMAASMSDKEEEKAFRRKNRQDPNPDRKGEAINVKTEEKSCAHNGKSEKCGVHGMKCCPPVVSEEGKKDACYRKVKSRYSVWPSAYASGALVKCRKKGAANWGNKTKKEGFEYSNWRDDFQATEYEFINLIEPKPICGGVIDEMIGTTGIRKADPDAPDTYKKNRDKKKKSSPERSESGRQIIRGYDSKGSYKIIDGKKVYDESFQINPTAHKKQQKMGKIRTLMKGTSNAGEKAAAASKLSGPSLPLVDEFSNWKQELDEKLNLKKADMGDVVKDFYNSDAPQFKGKTKEKRREMAVAAKLSAMEEDWQKVNKSDKTDGMSAAAVKAYRRENPGSKLKTAVTGDPKPGSKDAKRRKSFCARSKGQQDMHNIDCSKTPDKPVCKARRRWKC